VAIYLLPRYERSQIENVFNEKRPKKNYKNENKDETEPLKRFFETRVSFGKE